MFLLRGKKKEEVTHKEEWEDFKISDYVEQDTRAGPIPGGERRREEVLGMDGDRVPSFRPPAWALA